MLTFDSNFMTHANFHNYIVVRYDVFLSCIMTSNRRRFDVKLKPTLNQVFVLGVLKHFNAINMFTKMLLFRYIQH